MLKCVNKNINILKKDMHYLSVIAIFKNETMNLKVWLDHYIWQGVNHFYLIDNGSTDEPMNILQEYIDKGLVSYHYKPEKHRQTEHYREVFDFEDLKNNTYWLIMCDLDEFFYGVDKKLIIKLYQSQQFNVIYCNWIMFGTMLNKHPDDIRTAITHREPGLHVNTKYIFKPKCIINSLKFDQHKITTTLTGNAKRVKYANNLIRLNHYPIQSLEFFTKVKMTRGDVHNDGTENVRDMNYFNRYNINATENDETLKNLILNEPLDYINI